MSDPPPAKRRRNEDNGEGEASVEQQEVTFVYTGQPIEEIPRNITHVVVDPSVRRIEDRAFRCCQQLRSITIPPTVEAIGVKSFMWCFSLTDVHLHEGLKSIGTAAFRNCTSLEEVELPHGITEIAHATFSMCKSLRAVSAPITVTRIGSRAFINCTSLVDMHMPKYLKRIDGWAFLGCTTLSSVAFPPSLEFIGAKAFCNCKSLLSVEFPLRSNIETGNICFGGSQSLVNMSVSRPTKGSIFFGSGISRDKRDFLQDRFSSHPVHSLCYNSALATRDQMIRILDDSSDNILDDSSLKDAFEMTPFHILASSASLNPDILECLLDRYPMNVLGYKDCFGNTMMDYLLKHTSPRAVPLLRMVLKRGVVNTVSTWHPQGQWGNDLSILVESIPLDSDMDGRRQCAKDVFGHVGYCIRMEMTSLLELVIWKTKMQSMKVLEKSNTEDDAVIKVSCRYQSGAGVVIENVFRYLLEGKSTSETALSLFPLMCSSTNEES